MSRPLTFNLLYDRRRSTSQNNTKDIKEDIVDALYKFRID